jgi:hypothetical protein
VGRIVLGCYKPPFIVEACQGLYFIGRDQGITMSFRAGSGI